MLKVVFFDLFETLITERNPSWLPPLVPADYLGIDAARFTQEWRARWVGRMTGMYSDYASVLQDICQVLGHPVDNARIAHLQTLRLARKAISFTHVEDEIMALLHALRQEGIKVGVISNCTPEEVAAWSTSPLAECCDDAIFSYQVCCMKPDPSIYHLACRRLGVRSAETLFVGDGGSDELTGAAAVGIDAYQATWFLNRWSPSCQTDRASAVAAGYPRVETVSDLHALVMARCEAPVAENTDDARHVLYKMGVE